jgi:uncharacterized repeat protein (TIGR03843 family)
VTDQADDAEAPDAQPVDLATARQILETGDIELVARMPYSSNATFLVHVEHEEITTAGIYKPMRGERPLWDFPAGLHRREIAAFELSNELGWDVIPPTVERDGPHGIGSVQLFIDADFEQHHFTLVQDAVHHEDLRKLCTFDLIANNTDRKSGHCLLSSWGRIYGIDQGLCFSEDFKLRTVIWDFGGEPIPQHLLDDIAELLQSDLDCLTPWLDDGELEAMRDRARWLLSHPEFPEDDNGHRWPWPLV